MSGALRLVVFDWDGTVVDSQAIIAAAMTEAFRRQGLDEPAVSAVRRVVGLSLAEAIVRLLPMESGADVARLAEDYRDAFDARRDLPQHAEILFPGARAALEALEAAGCLLGVATGKSRRGLLAGLERHDLRDMFVTLQTADGALGKPHPAMLEQAMAEVGADPADTLMIGDTVYDVAMACNARVAALGVAWGYHAPAELLAAGAQAIVAGFPDLAAAVDAVAAAPEGVA